MGHSTMSAKKYKFCQPLFGFNGGVAVLIEAFYISI